MGAIFDKLINETEQNIATRPHNRSTDLDTTKPLDRRTYEEPRFIEDRYTEADRQVDEVKKRYEHLIWLIKERLEDLELMLQFMERCGGVFDLLDWANKTEKNLDQLQPKSDDIEPLEREIDEFRRLCDDISSKKVPVSDNTVHAEQFLRNTKDKLTPELQLELQQNVGELRTTYERLLGRSLDWLKHAQDRLDKLKRDRDETVCVQFRSLNQIIFQPIKYYSVYGVVCQFEGILKLTFQLIISNPKPNFKLLPELLTLILTLNNQQNIF